MTQNIPQVQNTSAINSAEFVKLKIFNEYTANSTANIVLNNTYQIYTSGNTDWTALGASSNTVGTEFTATANGTTGNGTAYDISIHTFSSAYTPETIDGDVYLPLGGLLQVGAQNRDLRVTSGDTNISLSGIGSENIALVLATKIRGSEVEVWRGFYDANMQLETANGPYLRFTGIVTSYGITEDRQQQDDNFTVTIGASSYKTVLENRIAGRKTNEESWKVFNPTDTSMDRVYAISGVDFDFGQDPKNKQTYYGGAGGGYGNPGRGGGGGGPGGPGWDPGRWLNQR